MGLSIYEIDEKMMALIDQETGELRDVEAFEELQMERDAKIENVAMWIKNLTAEAEAIRNEEVALAARRKADENKVTSLKNYLAYALNGDKFKTARISISYRKSEPVKVADGFIEWAMKNDDSLLTFKDPEPNKTAIKEAIKAGRQIEFAQIEANVSVIIK